jgi:predicted DNA-binding transcriptional regulator YafY
MKEKGSRIEELRSGGAYASIMLNGRLVAEEIDNDNQVEIKYELAAFKIKIASATHAEINDIPLALNRQAFNIIVLTFHNKEVRRFSYYTDENENLILTSK